MFLITGWFCLSIIIALASSVPYVPKASEALLRDRLCLKVVRGQFDLIQLKSFTFYLPTRNLVIFEGASKLYVGADQITPNGFSVDLNAFGWDGKELAETMDLMHDDLKDQQVNAIYYIYFGHYKLHQYLPLTSEEEHLENKRGGSAGTWRVDLKKYGAIFFTKYRFYGADFVNEMYLKKYNGYPNIYPELSLLHVLSDKMTWGYVIHRDYFDQTGDFVIYDMELDYQRMTIKPFKKVEADHERLKSAKFFFIEKTASPNEVLLVHRANRKRVKSSPNKQLFQQVPTGFRHAGYLYLFDSLLGCVYVLHSPPVMFNEAFTKTKDNILLKRHNVPFERFFQCPDPALNPFPLPANRCDTTDEHLAPLVSISAARITPLFHWLDDNSLVWLAILFCVALLAIAAAGAGYWFYYYGIDRTDELENNPKLLNYLAKGTKKAQPKRSTKAKSPAAKTSKKAVSPAASSASSAISAKTPTRKVGSSGTGGSSHTSTKDISPNRAL